MYRYKKYCHIVSCELNRGTFDASNTFFRLPKDPNRRQQWIDAVYAHEPKNLIVDSFLICRSHFDKDDIVRRSANRCYLKDDAIPKHFKSEVPMGEPMILQPNEIKTEPEEMSYQSDPLEVSTTTPISPINIKTEPCENPTPTPPQKTVRIIKIINSSLIAPKPCTKCIQLDGIMQHLKIKLDKVRTQLSVKSAAMARMQEQLDRYNAMFTKDITKSLECQFCLEKLSKEEYSQHSCGTGRAAIDCEYCSQCFPTTERLLHHLEYFHDDKTFYECDRCPKVFAMKDLMDIHISCHPAVDPQYQCEICDKNFFKPSDLNRHIDSSHLYLRNALHQKPPFQCGTCGERFDRADIMETHITQEHIEGAERRNGDYRLFECYVCKLRFVSMAGVRKHLSQHDLSQSCSVCNQMLSMEMFERHLCDSKSRELPCEYCNSIFSSVSELMNHLDVAHINGRKIYKCLECPKFFPMKLLKSFHKHPTKKVSNEQSFTCDICSKSFLAITSLIQHKKIHDPENNHICDKCGKGFRILGNLEKHFKIHTEPKFKCSDCPRKFHRKTAYNLHRDAAHRNAKYVCEYCDAELSSYTGLHHHTKRMHKRTDDDRHFQCTSCPKKFFENNVLRHHMKTVHSTIKQFPCSYCEAAYKHKGDLNKHLRTHLGDDMYRCSKCPERFRKPWELGRHSNVHYREERDQEENQETAIDMDQT